MTELIVALLKLRVWDPNRDALYFLEHTSVDTTFEVVLERVGVGSESSNPEFAPNSRSYTANGVVQSTVGVRIGLSMPSRLSDQGVTVSLSVC